MLHIFIIDFFCVAEPHKWQFRAYIYQARDILGLDSEGVSDAYAKVCILDQSKITRVVKETLCPDFDQTLIFEDLFVYGLPKILADNPPQVAVELYDEDRVVGNPYRFLY